MAPVDGEIILNQNGEHEEYHNAGNTYHDGFDAYERNSTEPQTELHLVEEQLIPRLEQRDVIKILSVGSGDGSWDLKFIKLMLSSRKFTRLEYHVTEPCEKAISDFKANAAKASESLEDTGAVKFTWFPSTWQEFSVQNEGVQTFDLVIFVQTLYYVKIEEMIPLVVDKFLSKKGLLVGFTVTNESFFVCLMEKFHRDLARDFPLGLAPAENFEKISEDLGLPCTKNETEFLYNVTEFFKEGSEEGSLLLQFLFHDSNIEKAIEGDLKKQILDYIEKFSQRPSKGSQTEANKKAMERFQRYVVSYVAMVTVQRPQN